MFLIAVCDHNNPQPDLFNIVIALSTYISFLNLFFLIEVSDHSLAEAFSTLSTNNLFLMCTLHIAHHIYDHFMLIAQECCCFWPQQCVELNPQPGGSLFNIEHSNQGLITFPGGVPLLTKGLWTNKHKCCSPLVTLCSDGIQAGGIGVSGSTVENDKAVAQVIFLKSKDALEVMLVSQSFSQSVITLTWLVSWYL